MKKVWCQGPRNKQTLGGERQTGVFPWHPSQGNQGTDYLEDRQVLPWYPSRGNQGTDYVEDRHVNTSLTQSQFKIAFCPHGVSFLEKNVLGPMGSIPCSSFSPLSKGLNKVQPQEYLLVKKIVSCLVLQRYSVRNSHGLGLPMALGGHGNTCDYCFPCTVFPEHH